MDVDEDLIIVDGGGSAPLQLLSGMVLRARSHGADNVVLPPAAQGPATGGASSHPACLAFASPGAPLNPRVVPGPVSPLVASPRTCVL